LLANPGLTEPPTYKANEASLADSEELIGVFVTDESRAYVVRAFEDFRLRSATSLTAPSVLTSRMRRRPL